MQDAFLQTRMRTASCTRMLVVIDMQASMFLTNEGTQLPRSEQTFQAVCAEIRLAKAENRYIVNVVMAGSGCLVPCVEEELKGYDRVVNVTKKHSDGSAGIIAACGKLGLAFDVIELCGVYTYLCVERTRQGLVKELPNRTITKLLHACWPLMRDGMIVDS